MPAYTVKNAILDLGFVDGCIRENSPLDLRIIDAFELALDRLEENAISLNINESRLLHDLGFVRGVMWLKPMPDAYTEAMDRLMEHFVEGEVDWYKLPQPFRPKSDNPLVADDQRDTVNSAYLCEGPEVAAEDVGLPVAVVDRIVHPAARKAWEDQMESPRKESTLPVSGSSPDKPEVLSPPVSVGRQWMPEGRANAAERARGQRKPPFNEHLDAVKADWKAGLSFDAIGDKFGCSGSHIRNFLTNHGIDPRRSSENARARGRPPLSDAELQLIIDEKAKGTPSKEIGEMIDRSQHAVDQKYSDLKRTGLVPKEHLTPETLVEKKQRQNELISESMKAFHAHKAAEPEATEEETAITASPSRESPAARWKPSPINPAEWPDIQKMLATGQSRESIASDYDVPLADLNAFIEDRLEEVRGRRAAKESPPGESIASLPSQTGGAI